MGTARYRRLIPLALSLAALGSASLSAVATAPAAGAAPAGASQQARHISRYVALGDSYAAGPFLPLQHGNPLGCARSDHNYPSLVAHELAVSDFVDVSCSAATTVDMTHPQTVPLGQNPPQFNALTRDTKLVTITISGNDIGFFEIATTCARLGVTDPLGNPCERTEGDTFSRRIDATAPKVAAVLDGIRKRAPKAAVALVSYLRILPHQIGCFPLDPFAIGDVPYLDNVQRELNGMLAAEAKHAHAIFVDSYTNSAGHDSCKLPGVRWVEPLTPIPPVAPLHPNATGMRAVASLVEGALGDTRHVDR